MENKLFKPILDPRFQSLPISDQKQYLILTSIYEISKSLNSIKIDFTNQNSINLSKIDVGEIFMYNFKYYEVSERFCKSLLNEIKKRIDCRVESNYTTKISEIKHENITFSSTIETIELLKKHRTTYKNNYDKLLIETDCEFLYDDNIDDLDFDINKIFFLIDLSGENLVIKDYLLNNSFKEAGFLIDFWSEAILLINCIKYCNKNINLLENQKITSNENNFKSDISRLIFKNTGLDIFNLIVLKYPKEKNTAFFSYLYFYLKDDLNLLLVTGNDNKDFRHFVSNSFNISFKRIQKLHSGVEYKRDEITALFRSYVSENLLNTN